jgi:hypothetical protein
LFDPARDLGSDQRVQCVFQPRSRGGIGENEPSQRAAIDLAVGPQDSSQNASRIAAKPGWPTADKAWAKASVSMISTPSAANASATAVFPLPMPPVRPTT